MKKILTVIGARPQFIKCAPVSRVIRQAFIEVLVHTGQHYDENMSQIFFSELNIPKPDYNLEIGSGNHGKQTGRMLEALEKVMLTEKPDAVIVYGDTNSTLAGVLAASKLLIPVIHIEAGLRSFNMQMPEEQNRIIADKLSTYLFCPTSRALENLCSENISKNVFNVGDVMYDSTMQNITIAESKSTIMDKLNLVHKEFILATIHRAENTDSVERLESIFCALHESNESIIMPIHPRTRRFIDSYGIHVSSNIRLLAPLGYFDMIVLEKNAKKVVTDSGGVQKEAFFLNTPCIVTRDETEWNELIEIGANILVGSDKDKITAGIQGFDGGKHGNNSNIYGDGHSAEKIFKIVKHNI